jgi:hypothetical protein
VHSESSVAVAVGGGQFGNPGRESPVVGNRYPRTSVGQQARKAQCVWSELLSVRNRDRL